MKSLNTICQNIKLKLVKMIKNFVKILELLDDRLEVCASVYAADVKKQTIFAGQNYWLQDKIIGYRIKLLAAGPNYWLQDQTIGCRTKLLAAGQNY